MKNVLNYNKYNKLNENLNDLFFTTPLINVMDEYYTLINSDFARVNNIPLDDKTNYTISESEFIVNWELDFNPKNYGIKDLSVIIKKIHGTFTVNVWGEDDDTPYYFDFNPEKMGFKIISKIEISSDIAPSNIEINFKEKIVIVK